jgi:hypothetical protein
MKNTILLSPLNASIASIIEAYAKCNSIPTYGHGSALTKLDRRGEVTRSCSSVTESFTFLTSKNRNDASTNYGVAPQFFHCSLTRSMQSIAGCFRIAFALILHLEFLFIDILLTPEDAESFRSNHSCEPSTWSKISSPWFNMNGCVGNVI